jgi:hypothetical protein
MDTERPIDQRCRKTQAGLLQARSDDASTTTGCGEHGDAAPG